MILRFKCASISGLSSDIIGSTSLHFWCISACCSVSGTPLKEFAFRPLFPHERCEEDPWVDRIGWATLICYGVFIPCFLGFLFAKQNVVMRQVKTAVMHTTCDEGTVKVWLQGLETKQSFKDRTCAKSVDVCRFRETGFARQAMPGHKYIRHISMTARDSKPSTDHRDVFFLFLSNDHIMRPLLMRPTVQSRMPRYPSGWQAAAAACVAIDVKGRAVVELQKDAVILGSSERYFQVLLRFFDT